MRAQFEAFATERGHSVLRRNNGAGRYASEITEEMWQAWCAAREAT